jgi:hypothetical protein
MVSGAGWKWPSGEDWKSYQLAPYNSLPSNCTKCPYSASGARDVRFAVLSGCSMPAAARDAGIMLAEVKGCPATLFSPHGVADCFPFALNKSPSIIATAP